ncbi:MAG: LysR family transcriptional regulator [Clostridia bacterium]|jgi:DNA-binding transcriptional LysR family regulator|nr:LysR family transcriptional regulator [Clostridia bacterium]
MTFLQLNYVCEVNDCGSINKAAQNLFVSQSNLSSSISELEKELGIKIFLRCNRGISLTSDGREFIAGIRPIVEQQKRIEKFYSEKTHKNTARVNISSQRYPFCAKAFVQLMNETKSGSFQLAFQETTMDRVIENTGSGKSDCGVIFLSDTTEKFMNRILLGEDIEFNEIKRIRPRVFFSEGHPLASHETIHIEELKKYPYLVFTKKNIQSPNFSEEAVLYKNLDFKKVVYVSDRASCYNILANSNAFSVGSGILPDGYYDERIISVPIADDIEYMRLGWIKLKKKKLKKEANRFIEILNDIMKDIV